MNLQDFFQINKKVAVAFSGGTDSAYLLYAAKKYGANAKGYFVKTPFQPHFELDDAKHLAGTLQFDFSVITLDIIGNSKVTANEKDRCYHCKRAIFTALKDAAQRDGFNVILDGTNASDDEGDRPGMRAISELSVLSPLRICGIDKATVRKLSKEAGLFTWDKPSYSCLATRIPTGTIITSESLQKVEKSENLLFSLGFSDFRARMISENTVNLQFAENQFLTAKNKSHVIIDNLKEIFTEVLFDIR